MPIRHLRALLPLSAILLAGSSSVLAQTLPPIRLSDSNRVPDCVTPERLMRFLAERNGALDPRFRDIAGYYRRHGEALRVRWDFAFYQMLHETNNLRYTGDVRAQQNNFAGLGATGGGVRGDSFPDVSTGVLAQIQHLVAYSGERVPDAVAPRTRKVQDGVVAASRRIAARRPVNFTDLTNRWAADGRYGAALVGVAAAFRARYCTTGAVAAAADGPVPLEGMRRPPLLRRAADLGPRSLKDDPPRAMPPPPPPRRSATLPKAPPPEVTGSLGGPAANPASKPRKRPAPAPAGELAGKSAAPALASSKPPVSPPPTPAAAQPSPQPSPQPAAQSAAPVKSPPPTATKAPCVVKTAAYQNPGRAVLIISKDGETEHYTVLEIDAAKQVDQVRAYVETHAKGGATIGEFKSRIEALDMAFKVCPSGR